MDIESTKISTRLATGFGLVFLLLIIVTALGINRVQKIDTILTNISDVNNVKQRYAINFRGSVHDRSIALRDVVLAAAPARPRRTSSRSRRWPTTMPSRPRRWTRSSRPART
jgi:methyl-accepting chemotaxis protein